MAWYDESACICAQFAMARKRVSVRAYAAAAAAGWRL